MMDAPLLKKSLMLPYTNLKRFIVTWILYILPIPLIHFFTNIAASGYMLNCIKYGTEEKYELPEWNQFWGYFKKGFGMIIISLIYSVPVLLYIIAGSLSDLYQGFMLLQYLDLYNIINVLIRSLDRGLVFVYFLFLYILILLAAYVAIASFVLYAKSNFGAAFNFKKLSKIVFNKGYAILFIFVLFCSSIISFLGQTLIGTKLIDEIRSKTIVAPAPILTSGFDVSQILRAVSVGLISSIILVWLFISFSYYLGTLFNRDKEK